MTLSIVQLHEGSPSLNDISGRLRLIADQIDSGELEPSTLYVVMPRPQDFPRLWGFGNVDGDNSPIIQLELMRHWLVSNLVVRM